LTSWELAVPSAARRRHRWSPNQKRKERREGLCGQVDRSSSPPSYPSRARYRSSSPCTKSRDHFALLSTPDVRFFGR
jgi:hypothetical protein